MKNKDLRKLCAIILSAVLCAGSLVPAQAEAVVKKPPRRSKNAAEYYTGRTLYYSTDSQKWIKLKGSLFYTYRAKRNTRYYRPLYYLTASWLPNYRKNLTIHLGQTRSKSVSSVVQSTLGVSSPNVSLATGISRNYSSTVSSSYTTDYTFVMKNYSTLYYYRPAFFGFLLKYGVVRRHRFLKKASIIYSYTFNSSAGLYLKLARR